MVKTSCFGPTIRFFLTLFSFSSLKDQQANMNWNLPVSDCIINKCWDINKIEHLFSPEIGKIIYNIVIPQDDSMDKLI